MSQTRASMADPPREPLHFSLLQEDHNGSISWRSYECDTARRNPVLRGELIDCFPAVSHCTSPRGVKDMSRPTRRPSPIMGRWFAAALASSLSVASLGLMASARANPGDPPGTIRSMAGTVVNYAQYGFSGDGGPATAAQLYNPRAV